MLCRVVTRLRDCSLLLMGCVSVTGLYGCISWRVIRGMHFCNGRGGGGIFFSSVRCFLHVCRGMMSWRVYRVVGRVCSEYHRVFSVLSLLLAARPTVSFLGKDLAYS